MTTRRPFALRLLLVLLGCVFLLLQARLWVSDDGFAAVRQLSSQADLQREENTQLAERNKRLEAEVVDLRKGFTALEERARSDLGLVAPGETFYVIGEATDSDGDGQ